MTKKFTLYNDTPPRGRRSVKFDLLDKRGRPKGELHIPEMGSLEITEEQSKNRAVTRRVDKGRIRLVIETVKEEKKAAPVAPAVAPVVNDPPEDADKSPGRVKAKKTK